MAPRELVVLGTSSMLPTRHRAHNSYALRWDDQLILFDPGEGAQRGCTLTGVAIARATAVCLTHFHGDHCLGLPGVIQRRSFDNSASPKDLGPLPIFYPADGETYFDRLHHASIFHDSSNVQKMPVSTPGVQTQLGQFELSAQPLEHRDTCYGYRLQEPDGRSVDGARLAATGISGPEVGRLLDQGWLDGPDGRITVDDVTVPKRGQSMAFVMDTLPCDGVLELARDVDMLVIESTYLHSEVELAQKYKHLTARPSRRTRRRGGRPAARAHALLRPLPQQPGLRRRSIRHPRRRRRRRRTRHHPRPIPLRNLAPNHPKGARHLGANR